MIEMLMEPLVEMWDIFGYGFETTPSPGLPTVRVTHAMLADNIFLLAKKRRNARDDEWRNREDEGDEARVETYIWKYDMFGGYDSRRVERRQDRT